MARRGFLLHLDETVPEALDLALQILDLLLMLALVLLALLLDGSAEMIERLSRMGMLFFKGAPVLLFGPQPVLEVGDLLGSHGMGGDLLLEPIGRALVSSLLVG